MKRTIFSVFLGLFIFSAPSVSLARSSHVLQKQDIVDRNYDITRISPASNPSDGQLFREFNKHICLDDVMLLDFGASHNPIRSEGGILPGFDAAMRAMHHLVLRIPSLNQSFTIDILERRVVQGGPFANSSIGQLKILIPKIQDIQDETEGFLEIVKENGELIQAAGYLPAAVKIVNNYPSLLSNNYLSGQFIRANKPDVYNPLGFDGNTLHRISATNPNDLYLVLYASGISSQFRHKDQIQVFIGTEIFDPSSEHEVEVIYVGSPQVSVQQQINVHIPVNSSSLIQKVQNLLSGGASQVQGYVRIKLKGQEGSLSENYQTPAIVFAQ